MHDVGPGFQNEMLCAAPLAGNQAVLAAFCLYVSLTSVWPFAHLLHHTGAADDSGFTCYNTKLLRNILRERDEDRALLGKVNGGGGGSGV